MLGKSRTLLTTERFHVVEHEIATGAGREPLRRQVVQHPGAVTIVALLSGERVCLIRNERIAVHKTLIELPAGTIDQGEAPSVTAARELQEETGYRANSWRELPPFFMSPGILNERMHLFVAEDLTPGPPAREANEKIENLVVPWEKAVAMALCGEIEDAKSLAGILLWDRLRSA
ncbi:MAG: NUDIX hydrolase [Pirellulales bacterium]|nr:NUDIX hydrolase [Pirellulales bacterium]